MSIINNQPPDISAKEVIDILQNNYGLKCKVKLLVSDIGQNFLVNSDNGERFIFKISNPSETYPVLEAQNQVLEFLQKANLDFKLGFS